MSPAPMAGRWPWLALFWAWGATVVAAGVVRIRLNWESEHPLTTLGIASPEARERLQLLVSQGGHALLGAVALTILCSGPWRWSGRGVVGAILAGLGLFLGAVALGGLIGPMPGVTLGQGVWCLVWLALAFRAHAVPSDVLAQVRCMARTVALVNLVALALLPSLVLQTNYQDSWVPGFTLRFHGLSPHAHQTAALAFVLLLLAWEAPPDRWRRWDLLLGLGIILFAQSKQFVVILLATGVMALALLPEAPRALPLRRGVVRLGVGLLLVAAVLAAMAIPDPVRVVVPEDQAENAETFTGRTLIWAHSVRAWEASPWFGNGPRTWLDEMAERFRRDEGWPVAHAHSQFYQTLAQGGLVGLAGMALAVVALVIGLWHQRQQAPWLVAGLMAVLGLRSLVEPAVYMNLIDTGAILVVVAVMLVFLGQRSTHDS